MPYLFPLQTPQNLSVSQSHGPPTFDYRLHQAHVHRLGFDVWKGWTKILAESIVHRWLFTVFKWVFNVVVDKVVLVWTLRSCYWLIVGDVKDRIVWGRVVWVIGFWRIAVLVEMSGRPIDEIVRLVDPIDVRLRDIGLIVYFLSHLDKIIHCSMGVWHWPLDNLIIK